jgi:hypothetical protein
VIVTAVVRVEEIEDGLAGSASRGRARHGAKGHEPAAPAPIVCRPLGAGATAGTTTVSAAHAHP